MSGTKRARDRAGSPGSPAASAAGSDATADAAAAGDATFRIADLARLAEVPASTIRLWESHGLVRPRRAANGYRVYAAADLETVRTIKRLRDAEGLNLAAIRGLLGPPGSPTGAASPEAAGGVTAGPAPGGPGAEGAGARTRAAATPVPWDLGARLKVLRGRRRLTLRAVAAETGLPLSLLSTIERTSQGASVASLHALAACYGTTFNELTRLAGPWPDPVVRDGAGRVIPTLGRGIRVEQLAEGQSLMDCQRWTLEPGAGSEGAYAHRGEEFIHVIAGRLEITLDEDARFELSAGDSIAFASSRLHAWRAPGPGQTVLLWVNCEPTDRSAGA